MGMREQCTYKHGHSFCQKDTGHEGAHIRCTGDITNPKSWHRPCIKISILHPGRPDGKTMKIGDKNGNRR